MNKFSRYSATKIFSFLLIIVLITIVLWRASQIINTPNLLFNSNFEAEQATNWGRPLSAGNPQVTSKLTTSDDGNTAMELYIPNTSEGSGVGGTGQYVPVESNQEYRVSLNYQSEIVKSQVTVTLVS